MNSILGFTLEENTTMLLTNYFMPRDLPIPVGNRGHCGPAFEFSQEESKDVDKASMKVEPLRKDFGR